VTRDRGEEEEYVRAGRGSRPRTKQRPDYSSSAIGHVLTIDRGRFTCRIDADLPVLVTATKARELGKRSIVVGDRVRLVGDLTGEDGTLARAVRVEPRRTQLRRTPDDDDPVERVLVANADQLAMVVAVVDPPARPRLIDRCLVAAFDAGMESVLIVTKADLADPAELIGLYEPLGVLVVVAGRDQPTEDVRAALAGRATVLVGHSGVGKSTLVNALVPLANRATGEVNDNTGRGRHTSTSAVTLELPGGGEIIDTPGVRSFGLGHVRPDRVLAAFDDLTEATAACPRACQHTTGAPECGLDLAVADGQLDANRVASFRRLLDARLGGDEPD
jgi:ribosome biogenesis GTPase